MQGGYGEQSSAEATARVQKHSLQVLGWGQEAVQHTHIQVCERGHESLPPLMCARQREPDFAFPFFYHYPPYFTCATFTRRTCPPQRCPFLVDRSCAPCAGCSPSRTPGRSKSACGRSSSSSTAGTTRSGMRPCAPGAFSSGARRGRFTDRCVPAQEYILSVDAAEDHPLFANREIQSAPASAQDQEAAWR